MSFFVHQIDQKTNKLFERISAIKRGWIKEIKTLLSLKNYSIIGFFYATSLTGQNSLQNFRWFFGRFEYTKRTFRNQMTFRQKQFPRSKGLFDFHVQNAFPLWNFLGLCDQMHFYCLFFSYSFILLPIEPSWFNFDGKKNVVSEQILIYVSLLLIFYLLNFSFRPVKFWMWNLNDS